MRKALLIVILVAAACSPGDAADSTTTSTTPTTSTSSTVAAQGTTTVAPVPSSTTLAPTTTTSTATTTTGPPEVEGDWAVEPLVTTDFGALGWWDGSEWLGAEAEGALPVEGGEDYQVTVLGELGVTTGGPQITVCDPLGLIGVELEDPDLLGDFPGPYGVAVSAPWPLQPHLFEVSADDGRYAVFAAELLADMGLDVDEPKIKQVIRTDLEGDGVNEVLVVAEEVTPGFLMEEGDYSIAFLRKVVAGEVETAVIESTVVLGEEDQFAGSHSIGGAADLNGDGKMEIITDSAFFEGFAVAVWEYVNDDLGPVEVLETGCGS
jgi:hypothetical protein